MSQAAGAVVCRLLTAVIRILKKFNFILKVCIAIRPVTQFGKWCLKLSIWRVQNFVRASGEHKRPARDA